MQRSVAIVLLLVFLLLRFRRSSEVGFPVLLRARWELVHMRQEHSDLPHIVAAEGFVPSRHAGIADTRTDGVEDAPLGIVWWIGDEIWRRRVKRRSEGRRFSVERTVAECAVHRVELHAVFQVLVRGHERVGNTGGMALRRSIDSAHGEMTFPMGRLDIRGGRKEAKRGEAESAQDEDKERDDNAL